MRILLINYRYFISGGPERYMFNVMDGLTALGHEIIPFSIHYTKNQPTPYARYFVEPLGTRNEVTFREQRFGPKTLWRTISRLFYSREVEQAVIRIVKDTRPQAAYVLHYLRKLSPSLLIGLKKLAIPIAVRLSDYGMLCPQAHFLRTDNPCELCTNTNLWHSIRYRCVQKSFTATTLNALATWFHRFRHYFDLIDVFVVTNQFMYNKMVAAGFSEHRLRLIPTFVNIDIFHYSSNFDKDNYIVYAGRIERLKGLHVLIDALGLLQQKRPDLALKLKIAGGGEREYVTRVKRSVKNYGLQDKIEFLGELNVNDLSTLLSKARFSVIPSLFYENLPNAILESYACGTPILVSNTGSFVDSVIEGETGYLFRPGNANSLASRIEYCLDHPEHLIQMGQKAREISETMYNPAQHLTALEALFHELVKV